MVERHDFQDGRSRYEEASDEHHDHLINGNSGEVIEFVDDELEELQKVIAERLGSTKVNALVGRRVESLSLEAQLDYAAEQLVWAAGLLEDVGVAVNTELLKEIVW